MGNIFDILKEISSAKPEPAGAVTRIIAGLGNPGDKYTFTRHNTGFLMMDYLSQKLGVRIDRLRFKALTGEAVIGGERVLLMKPQTFMNNSGEAISEAANFYKIAPENILIFSDDISLDVGRMRARKKGSAGGQNGLKSIILMLGTDEFPRVRIGIGAKPHPDYDLAAWVLSEFTKDEQKVLFDCFGRAFEGTEQILKGDFDAAMRLINTK